jgi:hypothetical protein
MPEQELITQTELVTFGKCEKRWDNRYVKWLTTFTTHPALSMGSAFHAGLDERSVAAAVAYLEANNPTWEMWEEDSSKKQKGIVSAMVLAALEWEHWPDKSEVQFKLPLPDPVTGNSSKRHRMSGVWDGVWEGTHPDFPDEVVLGEWKTASVVNQDYMQRLEIDFQVSAYMWAASQVYGVPVRKMVYRVVKKPTIRQKKDESVDEYVLRVAEDYKGRPEHYLFQTIVTRTDEQIDEWHSQAWAIHKRMLQIKSGKLPAIRNTQSCLSRGRCPYFDLCVGEITEAAFKKLETKHREIN